MKLSKAIQLFTEEFPELTPIGYWERGNVIVINTKPIKGLSSPAQFAVTEDGEVYGVTPMMYDLSLDDMIKI